MNETNYRYSAAPAKSKPSNNASSGAAVIDNGTLDEYQKVEDLGEKYPKKVWVPDRQLP